MAFIPVLSFYVTQYIAAEKFLMWTKNQLNCNWELYGSIIIFNKTFKTSVILDFLYPLYIISFQICDTSVAEILSTVRQMFKKYSYFVISVTISSNDALTRRITKPNAYGMWESIAPYIVLAGCPQILPASWRLTSMYQRMTRPNIHQSISQSINARSQPFRTLLAVQQRSVHYHAVTLWFHRSLQHDTLFNLPLVAAGNIINKAGGGEGRFVVATT